MYSVPCEWAGLDVTVHVGAEHVDITGPTGHVRHARKRFGERSIDYRHYIRELARKPQAVRQVASELIKDLGPPYAEAWRSLVDAHGPKQAARIFAKVLAHIEDRGVDAVAATLSRALSRNEPLLLALTPSTTPITPVGADLLPTTLRDVTIESGRASDYDVLFGGRS